MAIPYYRYVASTDDGCGTHQCLSCYREWEGRTSPEWCGWRFCPYCGVEWHRRLVNDTQSGLWECRTHDSEAWLHRRKQKDRDKWEAWERDRWQKERPALMRGWVIEQRECQMENGVRTDKPWSVHYWQSDHGVTTLRMVLCQLGAMRQQESLNVARRDKRDTADFPVCITSCSWRSWTEYRARVIDYPSRQYYNSTIWQHSNLEDTSLRDLLHPTPA